MSKPDLFNFSTHLNHIVGNELKEYGFKRKGNHFFREDGLYIDEVEFMRSRANMNGIVNRFYLEVTVSYKDTDEGYCIRLNYPSDINPPQVFIDNCKLPEESRRQNYTESEDQQLSIWIRSLDWAYSSERELIDLLDVAKDVILTRGFTYFDKAKIIMSRNYGYSDTDKMIRLLRNQLNNWIFN